MSVTRLTRRFLVGGRSIPEMINAAGMEFLHRHGKCDILEDEA
jgi:hypothetical protein